MSKYVANCIRSTQRRAKGQVVLRLFSCHVKARSTACILVHPELPTRRLSDLNTERAKLPCSTVLSGSGLELVSIISITGSDTGGFFYQSPGLRITGVSIEIGMKCYPVLCRYST